MKLQFWYYVTRSIRWLRNQASEWHATTRQMLTWAEDHYFDASITDLRRKVSK